MTKAKQTCWQKKVLVALTAKSRGCWTCHRILLIPAEYDVCHRINSLRTGSQRDRKKKSAGEASGSRSVEAHSLLTDRSWLVPLALDYTRLHSAIRPKPNREPVRRLQNKRNTCFQSLKLLIVRPLKLRFIVIDGDTCLLNSS